MPDEIDVKEIRKLANSLIDLGMNGGPLPATHECDIERVGRAVLRLASEASRRDARIGELEAKARAFVDKLDLLTPAINGKFVFAHIHGDVYDGPTWEKELDELRAALTPAPSAQRDGERRESP